MKVRVISEKGEQLGIMDIKDAQSRALDLGLDLVPVSPNATPPVCKIMDHGRHRYEKQIKAKEGKKKQRNFKNKEIRLRPSTGEHDLAVKVNQIKKFLQKGHKVTVYVVFKGREMSHQSLGRDILEDITTRLEGIGKAEGRSLSSPRKMYLVLVPVNPPEGKS